MLNIDKIIRMETQGIAGPATGGEDLLAEIGSASPEPHVVLVNPRSVLASTTCALNSDIDTGGGTDDTAELQALLDTATEEEPLELVLDGVARISNTLVLRSWTRILVPDGGGVFLDAGSNCHLVTGPNDGGATLLRSAQIHGGVWNQNGDNQHKWMNGVSYEEPSGPWDRVVGWNYGFWFAGFDGVDLLDVTIRNSVTFGCALANGQNFRAVNTTFLHDAIDHEVLRNRDGFHMFGDLDRVLLRNTWSNGDDDAIAFNTDEDALLDSIPEDDVRGTGGRITNVVVDGVTIVDGVNGLRLFGDSGTGYLDNILIKDFSGTLVQGGMNCSAPTIYGQVFTGLWQGSEGLAFIGRIEIDNYEVAASEDAVGAVTTDILVKNAENLIIRNRPSGVKVNASSGNAGNSPCGPGATGVGSLVMARGYYPIYGGGGDVTVVGTGTGVPSAGWWRMQTGATANSSAVWRPCSNVYTRFSRGSSDAGVDWNRPVTMAWGCGLDFRTGVATTEKIRIQLGRSNALATAADLAGPGIGIILTAGNIYMEAHNGTVRVVSAALATYLTTGNTFLSLRVRAWRGRCELWVNDILVGSMLGAPTVASADSQAGPHVSITNGATAANYFIDHLPGAMAVFVEP